MVSSSSRAESSHLRAVTAWLWPVLAQESGLGKQLGPLPLQQLAEVLSGAPSPGQQPPTEVYTMEGVPAKASSEEEDWSTQIGHQLPTEFVGVEPLSVELPTHETTFLQQLPEALEDLKTEESANKWALPELSIGKR